MLFPPRKKNFFTIAYLRKLHSLQRGKSALPTGRQVSSFTLIELLIVIGILAILTAAVVLVLNPSELLKQARDATRNTDLTSLQQAISALETQVTSLSAGTASTVYISLPDTSTTCANLGLPTLPAGYTYHCVTTTNLKNINGTGWLPIDFTLSNIQQFAALPIDPINTTSSQLYYTYIPGGSYELTALMESEKGSLPAQADTGLFPGVLEKGTHIGLTPPLRDRGLVGYWTFDEGTGTTAYDHSGNNNTGTLTNGPTWQTGTSCKVGGCLNFTTSGAYINTSNSSLDTLSNKSFSFSLWVLFNGTTTTFQMPIAKKIGGSKNSVFDLEMNSSGPVSFFIGDGSSTNGCSYSPFIFWGQWIYVVGTSNGNAISLYINGTMRCSNQITISTWSNTEKLQLGGASWVLNGLIDDVRVYNRALSVAEISAIYNVTK